MRFSKYEFLDKLRIFAQVCKNGFDFSLLEKGRQILMKDNLIDEERAKQEEAAQESLEQKLERLGKNSKSISENPLICFSFARFHIGKYVSSIFSINRGIL